MSVEPVQELVTLILEADAYFVRSNVRYRVEGATKKEGGRTAAYSDLDILAVKIDPKQGTVVDRLWGEAKAHLTLSLTGGYIRVFASDYATMLGQGAWTDAGMIKKYGPDTIEKFKTRQRLAKARAVEVLGKSFRRALYFGGRKPKDGGREAKALLDPAIEVIYVRDLVGKWIGKLTHLEGNEDFVRVINVLAEYGLIRGADDGGEVVGR